MEKERVAQQAEEKKTENKNLFIQLSVFGGCENVKKVISTLEKHRTPAVVYEDLNDPLGIGVVTTYENPADFVELLRPALLDEPFPGLHQKHEMTMLGRTYEVGYEKDLEYSLLQKPKDRLNDNRYPWGVWYPLRRRSSYENLPAEKQREIQTEHMRIARSFSRDGSIGDIRLAAFGLNPVDQDFVVALLGQKLTPLSEIVQAMRKSIHTSEYIESLGPFFVGRVRWRSDLLHSEDSTDRESRS